MVSTISVLVNLLVVCCGFWVSCRNRVGNTTFEFVDSLFSGETDRDEERNDRRFVIQFARRVRVISCVPEEPVEPLLVLDRSTTGSRSIGLPGSEQGLIGWVRAPYSHQPPVPASLAVGAPVNADTPAVDAAHGVSPDLVTERLSASDELP